MTDQRLPEGTDQIVNGDGIPEDDDGLAEQTMFTPDPESDEGDDGPDSGGEADRPAGGAEAGTTTGSGFADAVGGGESGGDAGRKPSGAADGDGGKQGSNGETSNEGGSQSGGNAFAGFNKQALFERIDTLKAQGYDQAKSYAQSGLDQASGAIEDVVRLINEAADQIDDRVGEQYGGYARRAAEGIGGFGDYFKDKDVDALFDQARELVKKSPAVAIGTAAALGFVVARLARAGLDTKPADDGGKSAGTA